MDRMTDPVGEFRRSPTISSEWDSATLEGGQEEFDALQFLERFIQQHQIPPNSSEIAAHTSIENRDRINGAHSRSDDLIGEQYDTRELPFTTPTDSGGFSYHVAIDDPPPQYEDIPFIFPPFRELKSSSLPPTYEEIRGATNVNGNNLVDCHDTRRQLSTINDSNSEQQNDFISNAWNRRDDGIQYGRVPAFEFQRCVGSMREPSMSHVERPANWMCPAVLATILFFFPLGVFAIWQAKKANLAAERGLYREGQFNASLAKTLTGGTVLFGLCMYAGLLGAFVGPTTNTNWRLNKNN